MVCYSSIPHAITFGMCHVVCKSIPHDHVMFFGHVVCVFKTTENLNLRYSKMIKTMALKDKQMYVMHGVILHSLGIQCTTLELYRAPNSWSMTPFNHLGFIFTTSTYLLGPCFSDSVHVNKTTNGGIVFQTYLVDYRSYYTVGQIILMSIVIPSCSHSHTMNTG